MRTVRCAVLFSSVALLICACGRANEQTPVGSKGSTLKSQRTQLPAAQRAGEPMQLAAAQQAGEQEAKPAAVSPTVQAKPVSTGQMIPQEILQPFLPPIEQVELKLYGTVFDANNKPLSKAAVDLYEGQFDPITFQHYRKIGSATTDSEGKYAITARQGVAPLAESVVVAHKQGLAFDWNAIAVRNSRPLEVPLHLGEPAKLAGTVVDEEGKPLASVTVRPLLRAVVANIQKQLLALPDMNFTDQQTDSNGRFEFPDLPATASAEFVLSGPGRARMTSMFVSRDENRPPYKAGVMDINLVLPAGGVVMGKLADEQGNGIAGQLLIAAPNTGGGAWRLWRP